jgi:hypothetical protein
MTTGTHEDWEDDEEFFDEVEEMINDMEDEEGREALQQDIDAIGTHFRDGISNDVNNDVDVKEYYNRNVDTLKFLSFEEVKWVGLPNKILGKPVLYPRDPEQLKKCGVTTEQLHEMRLYTRPAEVLTPAELKTLPCHPWLGDVEQWIREWMDEVDNVKRMGNMLAKVSMYSVPRYTFCKVVMQDGSTHHRYDTYRVTDEFPLRELVTGIKGHAENTTAEWDMGTIPVGTDWFVWRISRNPRVARGSDDFSFIIVTGEQLSPEDFSVSAIYFVMYDDLRTLLKRSWLRSFGPHDGRMC